VSTFLLSATKESTLPKFLRNSPKSNNSTFSQLGAVHQLLHWWFCKICISPSNSVATAHTLKPAVTIFDRTTIQRNQFLGSNLRHEVFANCMQELFLRRIWTNLNLCKESLQTSRRVLAPHVKTQELKQNHTQSLCSMKPIWLSNYRTSKLGQVP
jgi:hypothetical protein